MYVDEFYKFAQFLVKKANNGNCTPAEFNMAYKMASNSLFTQRYGLPEGYMPGRAVPRIAYELSQMVEDNLAPFKKTTTLFIDPATGYAPRPADYCHYIVVSKAVKISSKYCGADSYKNYIQTSIDVVTGSQGPQRRASQVVPPTGVDPICEFMSNYIRFDPKGIRTAEMEYLSFPADAIWGFTSPNGRIPLFDPATSVEVDWPVDCHFDLKIRISQFFGINLGMNEITQITQELKQQGE